MALRLHFPKTFGRQFSSNGAMNLIVELVGIQLHAEEHFGATKVCERFVPREVESGIKIRGHFGGCWQGGEKEEQKSHERENLSSL